MEKSLIKSKIDELIDLAKLGQKALEKSKNDLSFLIEYFNFENKWLEGIDANCAIFINKYLNNDELNCLLLINDIATLNNRSIISERIKRKIADIIANCPSNVLGFEDILLDCIKDKYKKLSIINEKLRYVFGLLCEDKDFLYEQRFIYMECINKSPNIKDLSFEEIEYCYILAKLIIDRLKAYNDSDLNNIETFRIINNYLILLRSIFIIVNNYDILIAFEEYYNKVLTNLKIKELVKNAFISNYEDEKRLGL